MSWDAGWRMLWPVALLCLYGFLKEFRPTEAYLYSYQHNTLNLSAETLNGDVYPIWTYAYLVWMVPVIALSDFLNHKPLIVVEAIAYLVVWFLLIFGRSVFSQQLVEVFYGLATAAEVAYFSHGYTIVPKDKFKTLTSTTRAALLGGKCSSYLLAQLLVLTHASDHYKLLNYISTASLGIGLVVSMLIPRAGGRYCPDTANLIGLREIWPKAKLLLRQAAGCYANEAVVKLSLWYSLTSCLYYQIGNYEQTLWGVVQTDAQHHMWNGFVEAACPLIGVPVVLLVGRLGDWFGAHLKAEVLLALSALLSGLLLLVSACTTNIYVMFIMYVIYRLGYQAAICLVQYQLSKRVPSEHIALVLGFDTFLALAFESILTLVVADQRGLYMDIRPQFYVYAASHGFIFILFAIFALITAVRRAREWYRSSKSLV